MTDDNAHSPSHADAGDLLERDLSDALAFFAASVQPAPITAGRALAAASDRSGADPLARRRRAMTASLAAAAVVLTVVGVVAITADGSDPMQVGSAADSPTTAPDTQVATSIVPGPLEIALEPVHVIGAPVAPPDPSAPTPEQFDPTQAPTVPTITGTSPDGAPMTIGPGAPRLIVVVAHWCPHCQAELPALRTMLADGTIPDTVELTLVSTAVDPTRGNFPPSSWIEAQLPDVRPLVDDQAMTAANTLGATSFPMFLAVDADGRLLARGAGQLDADQVRELVAAIAP